MDIIVSNSSELPFYQQIKDQIKQAILKGTLQEGDLLPSIRNLADDLQVSVLTIRRVYKNISHSGKVSNDFSLFRRFCCINRCFRCSCGKFAIVHGEQAAIGFRAAAIGEKRDLPETHPVQQRTESIRPCRSTRAKPASKELDRALSV